MKKTIGYWVCTGLVAFFMLSGGVADLLHPAGVVEGMVKLGYPPYFMTILGAWKVLGGATILAPRFPLVKEWAYAGIIFDLTGASASHIATGDNIGHIVAPLVIAAITSASWWLRPEGRRLKTV